MLLRGRVVVGLAPCLVDQSDIPPIATAAQGTVLKHRFQSQGLPPRYTGTPPLVRSHLRLQVNRLPSDTVLHKRYLLGSCDPSKEWDSQSHLLRSLEISETRP